MKTEQEDQHPARDYSPSIYSVRTSSSVGEDRDNEKRRFEENLIRPIQERERLDADWEQEQLEQEYGPLALGTGQNEPVHSPDIREHMTVPEAVEEEIESFENSGREQHENALSKTCLDKTTSAGEQQIHHELVISTHINEDGSDTGRMEVIDFTFWSFERGEFRVADFIRVGPSDTSL